MRQIFCSVWNGYGGGIKRAWDGRKTMWKNTANIEIFFLRYCIRCFGMEGVWIGMCIRPFSGPFISFIMSILKFKSRFCHGCWPYAQLHRAAVWNALAALLGGILPQEAADAQVIAQLPAALGGLGLLPAVRTSPAAYWAGPMFASPAPALPGLCRDLRSLGG